MMNSAFKNGSSAAADAFVSLEARLPGGCATVKFAKLGESMVFLDDDALLVRFVFPTDFSISPFLHCYFSIFPFLR